MRISIQMPAYNAEATIASALQSLLRQRVAGQLDIIVVDDGSTDDTCAIVSSLAATAPEIRLVRLAHGGISKARNAALRAMSPDTDLLGFLDADDLSPEGRLARDVGVLRADPSIDLIYSKVRFFDREDTAQLAPSANSHVVDGRIVNLAAGVFRRGLLDRVGPFDETLIQAEDLDFLLRIFDQKPSFVLSDHVGVFYRKNHGSMTENRLQMRQEMMKALLRARMRKGVPLPNGIITADHMGELRSWVK